jgi:hypothetical protein
LWDIERGVYTGLQRISNPSRGRKNSAARLLSKNLPEVK